MASVPQEVKLHILFAWRGDAFVLDYKLNNVRRLLLVDGGPKKYEMTDHKDTPFFRYYLAAWRNIWGSAEATMRLDIVVSHLDDDHYAGIYSLLTATQLGNAINWADVKLLLPYLNTGGTYTMFLNACGTRNLNYERLSQIQANQNRLAGFTMHYPGAQQILQFRNGGLGNLGLGQPPLSFPVSVFTETNQSSIIPPEQHQHDQPYNRSKWRGTFHGRQLGGQNLTLYRTGRSEAGSVQDPAPWSSVG